MTTPVSTYKDPYNPGPKIKEFHADKSGIRVLIGARNSGKTTAVMMEAVRHGWYVPGAKIAVFRLTTSSQADSAIQTLKRVLGGMGSLYHDLGETSLFREWDNYKRVRLPSLEAVKRFNDFKASNPHATKADIATWINTIGVKWCSEMTFSGLPDETTAQTNARSMEATLSIFVEADLIPEAYVSLVIGSTRKKDAWGKSPEDTGIIIETNPPSPRHWLARWEYGDEETGRPPKPDCKFWHIPIYDNAHNNSPREIARLEEEYRYDPAGWNRYILGEYDESFVGKPVYPEFQEVIHAPRNVDLRELVHKVVATKNSSIIGVRGWDYGGSYNATVWSLYFLYNDEEYWWDILECITQDNTVDVHCEEVLKLTKEHFPWWDTLNSQYDFGDIAGVQKTATGSVIKVVQSYGIRMGHSAMGIDHSIAIFKRTLKARNRAGRPTYQVDRNYCPRLYRALKGEYRYPEPGEPGYAELVVKPVKGALCNNADHVADCSRYAKANLFKLLHPDADPKKARIRHNLNPDRIPR